MKHGRRMCLCPTTDPININFSKCGSGQMDRFRIFLWACFLISQRGTEGEEMEEHSWGAVSVS